MQRRSARATRPKSPRASFAQVLRLKLLPPVGLTNLGHSVVAMAGRKSLGDSSTAPTARRRELKKYMIIGALLLGWSAAFVHHDDLAGLWLLSWPLGALIGYIVWLRFGPEARAARDVERYRPQAVSLRQNKPDTYMQMLAAAEANAPRRTDPDAAVAAFICQAEIAGYKSPGGATQTHR
jgi:hypothetical protein